MTSVGSVLFVGEGMDSACQAYGAVSLAELLVHTKRTSDTVL